MSAANNFLPECLDKHFVPPSVPAALNPVVRISAADGMENPPMGSALFMPLVGGRLVGRLGPRKYFLIGVTHAGCGGSISIRKNGSGEMTYEASCARCLCCDPNRYRTLKMTARESREYFQPNNKVSNSGA